MEDELKVSQPEDKVNSNSPSDWVKIFFNSYSQVVFLENVISGILILAGVAIYDLNLAVLSVIATIVGNLVAIGITKDHSAIRSGLYGFSPVLVGIGAGVFFSGIDAYIVAILASILVIPLTVIINSLCSRFELPGFTFPFIVITWFMILVSYSGNLLNNQQTAQLVTNIIQPNEALVFPDVLLKGIGEIFLLDSNWSSIAILLAFVVVNWKYAVRIVLVILLTIGIGYIFQVNFTTLSLGLMTYNSLLTYMGIETFSKTKSAQRVGLVILAVLFTVLVDMAVPPILGLVGLPSLTFPFVLVTWAMLYFEKQLILGE